MSKAPDNEGAADSATLDATTFWTDGPEPRKRTKNDLVHLYTLATSSLVKAD